MRLATICALWATVLYGQTNFDVASVKIHELPPGITGVQVGGPSPLKISGNRLTTLGTLATLVMAAYDLRLHQVSGGPDWNDGAGNPLLFDIQANTESGVLTPDRVRPMLRSLLAERFRLKVHQETKEIPLYTVTVDKNGPKLKETAPGTETGSKFAISHGVWKFTYTNITLPELVTRIASNFDQPLLDRTGLTGGYDVVLEYRRANLNPGADAAADLGPTIFSALQQVGLKIVHTKAPFEITVIDHAEKPSEN